MICSCQNICGMHELVDVFLAYARVQLDPAEHNSWKEALDGTESER